jgi:hypothetical protein
VCDGSGTGQTTLSWSAPGATNVEIRFDTGAVFSTGGSTGSVATGKWITNSGLTFSLYDVSGGKNVKLASVSVTLTTSGCAPAATLPPAALINNNISDWTFAAFAGSMPLNATEAQSAATTLAIISDAGNNGYFAYPASTSTVKVLWDLSSYHSMNFSLAALASSTVGLKFGAGTPYIVLKSANGQMTVSPTGPAPPAIAAFYLYQVPLSNASGWTAQTQGSFQIQAVTSVEVGFSVVSLGYEVFLADVSFQ